MNGVSHLHQACKHPITNLIDVSDFTATISFAVETVISITNYSEKIKGRFPNRRTQLEIKVVFTIKANGHGKLSVIFGPLSVAISITV